MYVRNFQFQQLCSYPALNMVCFFYSAYKQAVNLLASQTGAGVCEFGSKLIGTSVGFLHRISAPSVMNTALRNTPAALGHFMLQTMIPCLLR